MDDGSCVYPRDTTCVGVILEYNIGTSASTSAAPPNGMVGTSVPYGASHLPYQYTLELDPASPFYVASTVYVNTSNNNNAEYLNLPPGNYTLTAITNDGCSRVDAITVAG